MDEVVDGPQGSGAGVIRPEFRGVDLRFGDITADLHRVRIACGEVTVADHDRSWANHVAIADAQYVRAAKELRRDYRNQQLQDRARNAARTRFDTATGWAPSPKYTPPVA